MNIKDKNILITGAARGLGLAMANSLAERGANIGLIDLDTPELHKAAELCRSKGVNAIALPANVAEEAQVEAAVQKASAELGPLNGLVNNAGILRDGLLIKAKDGKVTDKLSFDKWQAVINVNLTGVFLCGREVAASMIESGSQGVIVNIASIAREGNFGQSNYSAAKAGVSAMTVTWSKELAKYGIRCAAIAPGVIETEMTGSMKPEAKARLTAGIPVGRMGTPEEIAQTVGFIFENDYYNGRVLELDGGLKL
ncbi:SDR family oxidoreductase [Endozoicomonas elysicola]|uniref:3-ketoacyl-ACP reductase n=1 Tax=Endozoicomonas elysicola TaxID=305900 RepID=A0A081K8A8_9GAMM|nr:SDR family oxidoreductase [Endozoicomonas elysicola]KEI70384.1 3-ketoacyl-ACP reductase [Endozoicomonas elysicola]